MTKYTVVGLWMDDDPPTRIAAWVEADDPDSAISMAEAGEGTLDTPGELLVAGVFRDWIAAEDEQ